MSDGYNGWKNYETWNVNLWLESDEGTYEYTRELTRDVLAEHEDDEDYVTVGALAERLREYVDELPEVESVTGQATLASDLLQAALSEVDWYEIAEHYVQDES